MPPAHDRIQPLRSRLLAEAGGLHVAVSIGSHGETIVDAGLATPGSLAAGLLIAELTMGGIAHVSLAPATEQPAGRWGIAVRSPQPVLACLGCQYAGWQLPEAGQPQHALGSGPARALARREPLFEDIPDATEVAAPVLIVECRRPPAADTVAGVAAACGVPPSALLLVLVPTTSLAGSVQVAARALEATLAKARHAGFPLHDMVEGLATSPLAPPHPDPGVAMGRTNDAILYGATAHVFVTGPAAAARALAAHLPSCTSAQHGRPFADILAEAGDFYAVDPLLFGPALARVTALETGETFSAGRIEWDLVDRSFSRAG